nr:hypothetical protein [Geitlerinema sp. P-1104]
MYVYHYRSFDINPKVISLAILGYERPQWPPSGYSYEPRGLYGANR